VLECFNLFFEEGEENFEILFGVGQKYSLASFGLSLSLWGLTICLQNAKIKIILNVTYSL